MSGLKEVWREHVGSDLTSSSTLFHLIAVAAISVLLWWVIAATIGA